MNSLPKSQELIRPLLLALAEGEVTSNDQLRELIGMQLGLTQEQLTLMHSGTRSEFEYRLAWARTKAKNQGLIFSPERKKWKITESGKARIG